MSSSLNNNNSSSSSSSSSRQRTHTHEHPGSGFGNDSYSRETMLSSDNNTVDGSSTARNANPPATTGMLLGGLALVICILSFVGQTVITRKVQESFVRPYFILWVSHSFWMILLPLHTVYEKMKRHPRSLAVLKRETMVACAKLMIQRGHRVSSTSQARAEYQPIGDIDRSTSNARSGADYDRQDGSEILATRHPARILLKTLALSALLAGLVNMSAYLWYVAVNLTSMSKVTAIYNMSCFFAYLFSILLLKERVQLSKCIAVGISILGVIVMTLIDTGADVTAKAATKEQQTAAYKAELFGDLVSLVCACGIGLYQVLYKKYAVPKNYHSLYYVNFMTATLGLCTLGIYWFPIPIFSFAGIEQFSWPTRTQFGYIVGNALFGVAYNGAFMIALALTSPLFAAIGVMLTIPVMAVVDMIIQGQVLAWNVFAGGAAILAGFSILSISEYQDTVRKADGQSEAASND